MTRHPIVTNAELLDRLRSLILEQTGIVLAPSKSAMIESRLKRRLILLKLPDLDTYLRHVFDDGNIETELPEIVQVITTNKTDFFREASHFRYLTDTIIPETDARTAESGQYRFRLWSAAASSGEEAWSAAMILARATQSQSSFEWAILGTDISERVLEIARRAVYPSAHMSPVPTDLRLDFTMIGKDERGTPLSRIVPEVRSHVTFRNLNLIRHPYEISYNLDVIFLRNVLIYFSAEEQIRVIENCVTHLRDGGYFFVGHSESMSVRSPSLRQIAPGIFRKEGVAA